MCQDLKGLEDLSRGILENSEKTSGDLYPDVVFIRCDDKHPPCVITALKPLQAVCFYIVRLLSGSGSRFNALNLSAAPCFLRNTRFPYPLNKLVPVPLLGYFSATYLQLGKQLF